MGWFGVGRRMLSDLLLGFSIARLRHPPLFEFVYSLLSLFLGHPPTSPARLVLCVVFLLPETLTLCILLLLLLRSGWNRILV